MAFTACEKEEIGGTAAESLAGEWYVQANMLDDDGSVIEDPYGLGRFHILTYNTSAAVPPISSFSQAVKAMQRSSVAKYNTFFIINYSLIQVSVNVNEPAYTQTKLNVLEAASKVPSRESRPSPQPGI